jgi:putative DNA primase/helicase
LFEWTGRDYRNASEGEIRCDLWHFLDGALQRKKIERAEIIVPFKPNKVRIGDTFDALRAAANIPATLLPPVFLDDPEKDGGNFLVLHNGILDTTTREVLPHSPRFFNLVAAGYDYDTAATSPTWERFKDDLFDDDLESRDTLEEILGLFLVPDTKYQKLFLIVGPRRAGKGVIGRIIPKLIGRRCVATPTITSLGEPFGLQELVGKSVAIVGDVRLRADAEEVAGNLLAISGEDGVTVRRKFKEDLSGSPIPVRFLLFSNELPHLDDPSGALSSRFIILQLTESFLGKEDPDLEKNLEQELPGILNQCLEGLQRLRKRGRFLQPSAGAGAVEALEALASPHKVFLNETFEWKVGACVDCDAVFVEWQKWCAKNGREYVGTKQRLGRDLRAASDNRLPKPVRRGTDERIRVYPGLKLK